MGDLLPNFPPRDRIFNDDKGKPAGIPFDEFTYGFGVSLLIGTQFLSRSFPQVALEVSKNVAGPGIAIGAGKYHFPIEARGLLFAPAPFGFVPPQEFGLKPNLLRDVNRGLGNPLPDSHLFRTLPDNHPVNKQDEFFVLSREQRRELERLTLNATVEELLGLYAVASSPQARRYFYDPNDIARSLVVSLRERGRRSGREVELEEQMKQARTVDAFYFQLPAPGQGVGSLPSPLTPFDRPNGIGGSDAPVPPSPIDTEPVNTLVAYAAAHATGLVRDLVTERADP